MKKTIKAWAVVLNYDTIVIPTICNFKEQAEAIKEKRRFKQLMTVVPCTITYTLPERNKIKK